MLEAGRSLRVVLSGAGGWKVAAASGTLRCWRLAGCRAEFSGAGGWQVAVSRTPVLEAGMLPRGSGTLQCWRLACCLATLQVREEELEELDRHLTETCELPVAGGAENSYGKVNILLQTYIGRGSLDSFSLISDQAYVAQVSGG